MRSDVSRLRQIVPEGFAHAEQFDVLTVLEYE
jgi:hypothetical protein